MDGDRFDGMTRQLAEGVSRRDVLRRLAGGMVGGSLALTGLRRVGARANKVGVCHQTGSASNPFNYIEVSENAVPAHAAHGDATYVDLNTDVNNCGACGNACVAVDLCNTVSCVAGSCVNTPITYTPNACEVDCVCDPGTGLFSCGARNCDDGNACTSDSCDPNTGCANTPIPLSPNACEVNCVCDPATGAVSCGARNCDDGNACTADTCDPINGCQHAPIVCDDNNACTEDSCNPASGCVHSEIPYTPNACEVNCVCDPVTGDVSCGEPDCDDDNVCTADTCDPDSGCQHAPTNEGGACITEDGEDGSCTAGVCEAPTCGDVSGVVSDASTGNGIAGATVSIGAQSTTTGGDGSYTIACVPIGQQTVEASATGYGLGSRQVNVLASGATANFSLVPESSASAIFLVLNWDGQPFDLDSHLSGPDIENAPSRFHIAYYDQAPVSYASLDVDDVDGHGPETVTVIRTSGGTGNFVPGEYRYWVHNFSTSPEFDVSNAVVTISKDGSQLAQYLIGGAIGNPADDIWHVVNFTLAADGSIVLSPIQTLQPGHDGTVL